jgi:outer membrane protein assembly factor BamA
MRHIRFIGLLVLLFGNNILFAQDSTLHRNINNTAAVDSRQTGKYVTVGDIKLSGNKKTKAYIILREMALKQGDVVDTAELASRIERSRQQVYNTSLFVDVNIYVAAQKNNVVFINVDLKERWYLFPLPYFTLVDRNFNEWWVAQKASLDRVNYGIKFMQGNFTGQNDNLNIWLINGYNQQVSVRYQLPFFDKKLKSGFSAGFLYSRQRELNYATDSNKQVFFKYTDFVKTIRRFDVTYSYRPDQRWRHYVRVAYNSEQLADTMKFINPNYYPDSLSHFNYIDFSYSAQYINLDYIGYPTKGFEADATIYKRGITKQTNLVQFGVHGLYALPLAKKTFLRAEGAATVTFPSSTHNFVSQRMFGYGNYQMQGYEYYVVDGTAGAVGKLSLHQEIFKYILHNPFQSKTHDKIPFRFFLKAYSNLGYCYNVNPGTSMLNNKLIRSWGLGLDVVSIYDFVFRIEYSFNQLGNQGLFLHARN